MGITARSRPNRFARIAVAAMMGLGVAAAAHAQDAAGPVTQAAAKPKGAVIRGCLTGSKLSHIEPMNVQVPNLPDVLRVGSIRVIRDQVKALSGHQVEVIGTLRGIPDLESGLLLAESDKAKFYLGGGDKNLGEDLRTERIEPPTIYANTIKDIAPQCTAPPASSSK